MDFDVVEVGAIQDVLKVYVDLNVVQVADVVDVLDVTLA